MQPLFRRLYRDERGMTFVFVGLSFIAFLTATTLAIDVGMFMVGRSEAQNAADAGALAGATALVFDSYTNRSATGPAVQSAITTAQANLVIARQVSVGPADVTFPNDAFGNPNRVKVDVFRTSDRGNPVPTLMGQLFGLNTVNILASATAEASYADAATCVLPFTVPDKWKEVSDGKGNYDGPNWDPLKTFDIWKTQGSNQNGGTPLANPDVYVAPSPSDAGYTGFTLANDYGTQMILKSNSQNTVSPSIYNPYELGNATGASDYENNIANCNSTLVQSGQFLTPKTGNMVGPTKTGVDALIAKDPAASWDTACNCIMRNGVKVTSSPRIGMIPLYDPYVYATGQQSGKSSPQLQVVNLLGFFIEAVNGAGEVTGRIVPAIALKVGAGAAPAGFARVIRLVQ
jgi:putative Flp pilus-assembly TadE/G-like protein